MPPNTWNTFFDHFSEGLKSVTAEQFARAWNKEEERTNIYRSIIEDATLVPAMSQLKFQRERCRIDFMLGSEISTERGLRPAFVPVIAIESENKVKDAAFEVDNLCALACPTKLLITCAIWSRQPQNQLPREVLLQHWSRIYTAHRIAAGSTLSDDVLAVVVGERTRQNLRFYLEFVSSPLTALPAPFHTIRLPVDEGYPAL